MAIGVAALFNLMILGDTRARAKNEETRVICGFLVSFEIVLYRAVNPSVVPAGLEPATSSLGNLRSIQLNYGTVFILHRSGENGI